MKVGKTLTLTFYADPGHGWLRISREKLLMLPRELAAQISSYSYQSKSAKNYYLEEDHDANLFVKWAKGAGFRIVYNEISVKGYSTIRDNPHFTLRSLYPDAVLEVST